MRSSLVIALLALSIHTAATAATPAPPDPYLWLEDLQGSRALDWVRRSSKETVDSLTRSPHFAQTRDPLLRILNAEARIPYVVKYGDRYYNHWKDALHPRGVWRRTTLEEYRKPAPDWEVVLDIDSLATAENENWVWGNANCLAPDYTRCLLTLSRGGGDAKVTREFDVATKRFVEGGFYLPESKGWLAWIDKDHVYLHAATDSADMTAAGYPRVVREWTRGTRLVEAKTIFEAKREDAFVSATHSFTPGYERDFVERYITRTESEIFLRRGKDLLPLEKPLDAEVFDFREWIVMRVMSDWNVAGRLIPVGTLLAADFDAYLAGSRTFDVLFAPGERRSLHSISTTRSAVFINELENVRCRVYALRSEGGAWRRVELPGLPELATVNAQGVAPDHSDEYWLRATGYLTPPTLSLGALGGGAAELLKQSPSFFRADGLSVRQFEATSKDGTRIPYFQVAPDAMKLDGSTPTLLMGYGGFESSMTPGYDVYEGSSWLQRGGVYVVANIRGGGEFGPAWHLAATKEGRLRAYEDFIAVAEDLVRRGVTSPRHLACWGSSNGGLLVGNMLTMRPDLFGAVVCFSPLLDMRRYTKLSAGRMWIDEYGDPDIPEQWRYIQSFSPYQKVRKGVKYPPILITSSGRDDRVHPGHARKMAAKLKAAKQRVLYYENVEGGHGRAANHEQSAFLFGLMYSFLWTHIGNQTPSNSP